MPMLRRYAHNLSHTVSGTMNMGRCYPGTLFEVFPGDSFSIQAQNLSRFMPQIGVTMADVAIGVDFYQVPLRQIFDKIGLDWDAFLTGGENGDDTTVLPTITIPETGYDRGGLADWLNYPCNYFDIETNEKVIVAAGKSYSAIPVIVYMHIINENYRDQNFIAKLDLTRYQAFLDGTYVFETPAGDPIQYDLLVNGLFRKAWSRDYFNRGMSNTQRGRVVSVPLSGIPAPVVGNGKALTMTNGNTDVGLGANLASGTVGIHSSFANANLPTGSSNMGSFNSVLQGLGVSADVSKSGLLADLSGVPAFDLVTFRLAARMQRFGEILQRGGARAVEFTYNMFGVRIPDGRIQRPLFYGSFRLPVIFSEVLQTSSTDSTSPQGNLAGHGITGGTNKPIHVKVIEHGFMMAIVHVMPKSQYQNIVPKYLLRKTRWDMPNPLFQHVGDQKTERQEIYPNSANPTEAFSYNPRYSELSFIPSTIHGLFKDDMLSWTMARVFKDEPVLGASFRYAEPSNRSFAVQYLDGERTKPADQMNVQIGFIIKARRLFARNPQPGIHIV